VSRYDGSVTYDAVIVPGGGVRAGGELPAWVKGRFDLAIERSNGAPIVCLSAGTTHRPNPLDATGRAILEASAGGEYLLRRGVEPDRIFLEAASWDTIGNAYFARTIHTGARGWRTLLVITSEYHMPRTEAIFRWVFGLAPEGGYGLSFEAVPDVGLDPALLEARRQRERASLAALVPLTQRIRTLPEMHQWLFTCHAAYHASLARPEPASGIVAEAY
jgi:DUF218 domain